MLERTHFLRRLETAAARSPITALLGPRQCGKTTLARQFASTRDAVIFDLESDLAEAFTCRFARFSNQG